MRLSPWRYVCLHPGARIGDALFERGYEIVLTGSSAERPITDAVAHAMRKPSHNFASSVSIGALAALLANARLLVTNDTGVSQSRWASVCRAS